MNNKVRYTKEEKLLIKELYPQQRFDELKKLLTPRHSWTSVKGAAAYYGWNNKGYIRQYVVDYNYFSEPNPENSYWAGFIAADGYIPLKNGKRIYLDRLRINLQECDKNHLETFKEHVGFTGPVKIVTNGGASKGKKYCSIEIMGVQQWIKDLEKNFNITHDKSDQLVPPTILGDYLLKCYIIGFLDGDGSIKNNTRLTSSTRDTFAVEFNGLHSILSFIKNKFDLWYPVARKNLRASVLSCSRVSDTKRYSVNGKRSDTILSDFIKCEVPFLGRKWDKVFERLGDI